MIPHRNQKSQVLTALKLRISEFQGAIRAKIRFARGSGLIRVHRFGTESLRQGRFPRTSVNGQARLFALTPFVPLSREAGEGDKGGEGNTARLPVHACAGKNSPCCRDSVPSRCTLVSSCRFPPLREGNRFCGVRKRQLYFRTPTAMRQQSTAPCCASCSICSTTFSAFWRIDAAEST